MQILPPVVLEGCSGRIVELEKESDRKIQLQNRTEQVVTFFFTADKGYSAQIKTVPVVSENGWQVLKNMKILNKPSLLNSFMKDLVPRWSVWKNCQSIRLCEDEAGSLSAHLVLSDGTKLEQSLELHEDSNIYVAKSELSPT